MTQGSWIEFIRCSHMSKVAEQSYSHGINQPKSVWLFRYSDCFSRYPHLKLESLKVYKTCGVNGHHGKNNPEVFSYWHIFS